MPHPRRRAYAAKPTTSPTPLRPGERRPRPPPGAADAGSGTGRLGIAASSARHDRHQRDERSGHDVFPGSMHDDGLQEDSIAYDKIYSGMVPGLSVSDFLQISFTINNQAGKSVTFSGPYLYIPIDNAFNAQLIDINNFNLPINNMGVLADVLISPATLAGGMLQNKIVLYSGGFFMSGLTNGTIWANGVATSSRVQDYLPGMVGASSTDTKNVIYVVKSSDQDFGQSWQNWKLATNQGADFYDGDHDGVYNPVDKNGNGKWDPDEDRPANLGDFTAWCVYNDGVPAPLRLFTDVSPQGIEIQQTAFAKSDQGDLGNVIFVKYRLFNRGTVADVLNSVYFSAFADPDIGDNGALDLAGCDTLLNAGYTYHPTSESGKWGSTPPAFIITGMQGPISYISGVTYVDNNSNGIYDESIDTPLDTAFNRNGPAGIKKYPGAKNLGLSSFHQYYNGIDPANRFQLRDYTLGLDNTGTQINPCTWSRGVVFGGVNCANVNPLFMYSGDPINYIGWINNTAEDQRIICNYGPFDLKRNQPVDIVLAYVVGQGNNGLNSVSVAKGITNSALNYYNTNYSWGATSVSDKNNTLIKIIQS